MAYDPENPPSLIAQGIGGTTGLRWFALMWTDTIATVLTPGYISNASEIGMRAGDGLIYKDTNRGEWDHYDLIVHEIAADGSATLRFPEVPEEALPLESITEVEPNVYAVVYRGGRQVRIPIEQAAAAILTGDGIAALSFTSDLGGAPATIRSVLEREVQGLVGDATTANTTVLEAAWERATGTVYDNITGELDFMDMADYDMKLPPGRFLYTGGGLDWITRAPINLIGAGDGLTEIIIPDDVYFMDLDGYITSIMVRGIKFIGGKGAYRNSSEGINVSGRRVWRDCCFSMYTEAAINENGADAPNMEVTGNIFVGEGGVNTIGVAVGGLSDISVFQYNLFLRNAINLKFRAGRRTDPTLDTGPAPNTYIGKNDMTRFVGSGLPVTVKIADIWLEPNPDTNVNSGTGLSIRNQKFGNENYIDGTYKILIADVDETEGTDNGNQWKHKTTKSEGFINGVSIGANVFQYAGSNSYGEPAPVFSYTPNLEGLVWEDSNMVMGTAPAYRAVQFAGVAEHDGRRIDATSIIHVGPSNADQTRRGRMTNGNAFVDDPMALVQSDRAGAPRRHHSGNDDGAFSLLPSELVSNFTLINGATISATTDSLGGSNATEITFASQSSAVTLTIDGEDLISDLPMWAIIDVLEGATLPAPSIQLGIRHPDGQFYASRAFETPSFWREYIVPWFKPVEGVASWRLDIRPENGQWSVGGTKVRVGRPRVFQADNPVNFGHLRTYGGGHWDDGHIKTGNFSLFLDAANRLRLKETSVPPSGDTDGAIMMVYQAGSTASRPATNLFIGRRYYDTDIGRTVTWNGSVWRVPVLWVDPPAGAGSPGEPGMEAADANYFYVCVATDTWKRVAIASW